MIQCLFLSCAKKIAKTFDKKANINYNNGNGEVSERFKEPVLKTGDAATHRGFESHPLRHVLTRYSAKRENKCRLILVFPTQMRKGQTAKL